jgi:competence protein ComEA
MRVLLAEGRRSGWLPDDDPADAAGPASGVALLRRGEAAPPAGPAHRTDDLDDDLDDDLHDDLHDDLDDDASDLPAGLGRHRAPARTLRVDPGRRGNRALWAAGLLAAVALAGWTWLDRPRVEPAPPVVTSVEDPAPSGAAEPPAGEAADAQQTAVVSVVGLVARPGLVTLPAGARVADAVAAAGGLLPEADPASVNLAAVVSDGQQVAVGVPGAAPAAAPGPESGTAGSAGPLDVNAATATDLDALPGIGPVLAQRIVDHREANGRFTSVEQLDDVPGIGPATYAELADLVRV